VRGRPLARCEAATPRAGVRDLAPRRQPHRKPTPQPHRAHPVRLAVVVAVCTFQTSILREVQGSVSSVYTGTEFGAECFEEPICTEFRTELGEVRGTEPTFGSTESPQLGIRGPQLSMRGHEQIHSCSYQIQIIIIQLLLSPFPPIPNG
jgi:hypothetical protein